MKTRVLFRIAYLSPQTLLYSLNAIAVCYISPCLMFLSLTSFVLFPVSFFLKKVSFFIHAHIFFPVLFTLFALYHIIAMAIISFSLFPLF